MVRISVVLVGGVTVPVRIWPVSGIGTIDIMWLVVLWSLIFGV